MNFKVALVDMDGTILGKDQVVISPANMEMLEELHRRGVLVVPCTGRVVDMLPPQLLALDWIRYVISCHGTRVYDRATGKSIFSGALTPEASAVVLRAFEGRGVYAEVAAEHTIYIEESAMQLLTCPPVPSHHVWYMIENRAFTAVPCLSEHFLKHGLELEKVNMYNIPEEKQRPVYEAVTATGLVLHTSKNEPARDLEFSGLQRDKDKAVDALFRHLGVTFEDVLAIGDSSTDLEVIRRARMGVAMGNASEAVKSVANYITETNVNDGFAAGIRYALSLEEE